MQEEAKNGREMGSFLVSVRKSNKIYVEFVLAKLMENILEALES